jgi:hypothetical protein
MIKFLNILKEAKQVGTLYHNSQIWRIKKIIKDNKLEAISNTLNNLVNFRTKSDDVFFHPLAGSFVVKDNNKKYPPYVSFTRNKTYARTPDDVKIILDGNKLSQKYKIIPYSHFGGRKIDEMEERIYKDVTNLDKYIIKLILPFNEPELESLLKEKNIPYEIK